jgi:anti-sigma factor RsiW
MNHEPKHPGLDEYIDGALAPDEALAVERHLADCEVCREELAALRGLLADAASLPASIEPGRDLWPEIDARLDAEGEPAGVGGRTLWSMRYQLAAAAVLLVVVSSAVTSVLSNRNGPRYEARPPGLAVESRQGMALVAEWQAVEADYVLAARELVEALEAAKPMLSEEAVQLIESNLRIIDEAIRESRAALALDPTNGELMEMLSATYLKKVEMLQHVNRVAAEL